MNFIDVVGTMGCKATTEEIRPIRGAPPKPIPPGPENAYLDWMRLPENRLVVELAAAAHSDPDTGRKFAAMMFHAGYEAALKSD